MELWRTGMMMNETHHIDGDGDRPSEPNGPEEVGKRGEREKIEMETLVIKKKIFFLLCFCWCSQSAIGCRRCVFFFYLSVHITSFVQCSWAIRTFLMADDGWTTIEFGEDGLGLAGIRFFSSSFFFIRILFCDFFHPSNSVSNADWPSAEKKKNINEINMRSSNSHRMAATGCSRCNKLNGQTRAFLSPFACSELSAYRTRMRQC